MEIDYTAETKQITFSFQMLKVGQASRDVLNIKLSMLELTLK